MTTSTVNKNNKIIEVIKNREGFIQCNLDEFRDAYHDLIKYKLLDDLSIFAVFMEERVLIVFPEVPKVRILISTPEKFLIKADLDFVANIEFFGTYEGKYNFKDFVKKEIELNIKILLLLFVAFSSLVIYISKPDMIRNISILLVTSTTLFVTIFILFVISQRQDETDYKLLEDDDLYLFFQNDKYIIITAFSVIFISIFNTALSYLSDYWSQIVYISSVLTGLSVSLLGVCFLAISQYYFERVKTTRYLSLSEKLIDQSLKRYKER